jgi:hypothetical protein
LEVKILLKNNGKSSWPENCYLRCVNAPERFKGERIKVRQIKPGESYESVIKIEK